MNILFAVLTLPITIVCYVLDQKFDMGDRMGNRLNYRPRFLNFMWAAWFGYFWLPCHLCGKKFGGHESCSGVMTSFSTGVSVCKKCAKWAEERNKNNDYFRIETLIFDGLPEAEAREAERIWFNDGKKEALLYLVKILLQKDDS